MSEVPELLNNPFCGLCGQPMDAAECAFKATETSVNMALSLVDLINKAHEEGRQAGLREAVGATQAWTRPRDWGDTQEKRDWRNGAEYVGVKIAQDILALTNTPTPPDETGCQECGGENPVWFAPHDLWNRVMGGEDCKDDPGGILCPVCFIRRAERVGIKEIWRVGPVEDNPPVASGDRHE